MKLHLTRLASMGTVCIDERNRAPVGRAALIGHAGRQRRGVIQPGSDMMKKDATVFVVDSDTLSRNAVHEVICRMNLRCQTYASGQRFLDEYDRCVPGCLVCEVQIPDISGLEIQRRLAMEGAPLPVVFLTGHATVAIVVRAMCAGAVHFMTKPPQEDELWEAVQKAVNLDRRRRTLLIEKEQMRQRVAALTPGERDVWELWVNDNDVQAIADRLGISVRAVEHRQNSVLRKLGIRASLSLLRYSSDVFDDGLSWTNELATDTVGFHWEHGPRRLGHPRKVESIGGQKK